MCVHIYGRAYVQCLAYTGPVFQSPAHTQDMYVCIYLHMYMDTYTYKYSVCKYFPNREGEQTLACPPSIVCLASSILDFFMFHKVKG
jgi:hypothetical protein